VPLLEKALDLRRRIAAMLSYDTWAYYIMEVRSAKNAKGVSVPPFVCHTNIYTCTRQFLDDLETKLCPAGEKECEILLQKNMRSVVFRSMINSISGITGKAHPTL
jgi:Zn-dependent oligopeptidase